MLYPIAIEKGSDTEAYGATVPDIAGCYSAGDTLDEALVNAREAIEMQLEALSEAGQTIPAGRKIDDHLSNEEFEGHIWCVIDVDLTPYLGKSQKINVTLPETLLLKIDKTVAKNPIYKTRSGFLATAAMHELSL